MWPALPFRLASERFLAVDDVLDPLRKIVAIQVAQPHGERAADLVAVAGADAAHRGADVLAAGAALVERFVFGDVPGKDHVRPIADQQVLADLDAAGQQAVDLLQDAGRVEHHAAGDDALHAGSQDAAGNQRQLVGLAVADDGMAGVAAPLVADDDIVLFGQQVDEFAFGFVSPLQTDHASHRHRTIPLLLKPLWAAGHGGRNT